MYLDFLALSGAFLGLVGLFYSWHLATLIKKGVRDANSLIGQAAGSSRQQVKLLQSTSAGADTGGDVGDASPPPDPKKCWHDIDFIENHRQKYFCTAHYSLKDAKN